MAAPAGATQPAPFPFTASVDFDSLSQQIERALRNDGFIVLRRVLDPALCHAFKDAVQVCTRAKSAAFQYIFQDADDTLRTADQQRDRTRMMAKISSIVEHDAEYRQAGDESDDALLSSSDIYALTAFRNAAGEFVDKVPYFRRRDLLCAGDMNVLLSVPLAYGQANNTDVFWGAQNHGVQWERTPDQVHTWRRACVAPGVDLSPCVLWLYVCTWC